MAIKRSNSNPVIVLDVVVTSIEADTFNVRKDGELTGEVQYKGRRLAVQTGAGPSSELLEVRVPLAFDDLEFEGGQHVLINAEYSEYRFMDNGREVVGSVMRFHSFVSASQFDGWKGVVQSQNRVAQPA